VPDETHRRDEFSLQITYRQEYVEEENPGTDLVQPVLSPESSIKASTSGNNKILCFLALTSVVCLGAVVIAPIPIVEATAAAIWLGSLKLAQGILNHPNKKRYRM
jgi:hypothetical protein